MEQFQIYELAVAPGRLALCPLPGRFGSYQQDLAQIAAWRPAVCLTMTEFTELSQTGADAFGQDLAALGCKWHHLPIRDFGAPPPQTRHAWPRAAAAAHVALDAGGRVLVHCRGGCGRSGMAALRLMVERGEPADDALTRLRAIRPCAVETEAQHKWAAEPDG